MEKISGVYKITNAVTGDFYIGSSKNIKQRWACHKTQSTWNEHPNSLMYYDMQKYGTDKFDFEILAEVESSSLKEIEQQFIETLKPTYNNYNAKGLDVERYKKAVKEYQKSNKYKDYQKSIKCKEYYNKYYNQPCYYNGEIITLNTLSSRFRRAGIEHPTTEAKRYLLKQTFLH